MAWFHGYQGTTGISTPPKKSARVSICRFDSFKAWKLEKKKLPAIAVCWPWQFYFSGFLNQPFQGKWFLPSMMKRSFGLAKDFCWGVSVYLCNIHKPYCFGSWYLLMEEILHQLIGTVVYPIIYSVFFTSFRWLALGFLNHQQYLLIQTAPQPAGLLLSTFPIQGVYVGVGMSPHLPVMVTTIHHHNY